MNTYYVMFVNHNGFKINPIDAYLANVLCKPISFNTAKGNNSITLFDHHTYNTSAHWRFQAIVRAAPEDITVLHLSCTEIMHILQIDNNIYDLLIDDNSVVGLNDNIYNWCWDVLRK